ncbi:MAG: hypothetical protein NC115_08805 [Bacteroidales bacterium]|nr:hypothetical protein [Bacteroides sp.]MCM1502746.1 hypothetical protein [Bacteroidales bacterium]
MANFIKKALELFKGEDGKASVEENNVLTNKILLKELVSHFRTMLEKESVGHRMLYPMSFNILMESEDYNDRIQSLPFVLPEVVAAFYGIIDSMKGEFPNYEPPAKYWFFQFSSCSQGNAVLANSAPIVRKGHIATVSTLMTFDIREARNTFAESNTRVSIKLDDSNVMNDVNVNQEAIKTLDIIGNNIFTYNFDKSLSCDSSRIKDSSNMAEVTGLAVLSYSRGGKNYHFTMKDNLIHISGKNEKRTGRSFFILETVDVKDSHVQIKYVPEEKKFQIAAFGLVRLNGRKLTESSGAPQWHSLANNSSIFINDEISVKFEIK